MIASAGLESSVKQLLLEAAGVVYLVFYCLINLLPEAWHRRHTGRLSLTHAVLNLVRISVYDKLCAERNAEARPSALKDMGERQEAHYAVAVVDRHCLTVSKERCVVLTVSQHHTLALARCAAGVEYVAQIVEVGLCPQLLHLRLPRQVFAQFQKLLEREGVRVVAAHAHRRVEIDDALERRAQRKHAVCLVVLLLFADKDELHLGVVYHVLYLLFAAGSIKRHRHRPHAIGAKVGVEVLDTIL